MTSAKAFNKTSNKASNRTPNKPSKPQSAEFLSAASLCSLAIALWGWHTGLWFLALPMLLAIEARRFLSQRWQMSVADLQEIAKLSGAIFGILFAVIIVTQESTFIYILFQWLPVAAFPLVMAQTYGLGVSDLLREKFSNPHLRRQGILRPRSPVNLHYAYFSLCILSASAADSDGLPFYIAVAVLVALLFWHLRAEHLETLSVSSLPNLGKGVSANTGRSPSRRPLKITPVLWLLLFFLSAGLGWVGHLQLTQFQQQLELQMIAMIGELASGGAIDPDGSATRMGSVGRLKLSNSIAFRVSPGLAAAPDSENSTDISSSNIPSASPAPPTLFPLLLQEATYNQYQLSTWRTTESLFRPIFPGEIEGEWRLSPIDKPIDESAAAITISTDLERGDGILTLPHGTTQIRQLPVEEMQKNQYGAVQVDATGDAVYTIEFSPPETLAAKPPLDKDIPISNLFNSPPTVQDLQIPKADQAAIDQVLQQLATEGKSEQEIIRRIAGYFQDFKYSLDLIRPTDSASPVSDFLLNTQTGHCEYFATATALLLRGAGIPARYAVGYSAHELSQLEGQYIVRDRDAHAWTRFYLDGRWQTLDTTPSDWAAQEREMMSSFQIVSDFFSFASFEINDQIRQLGDLGLKEMLMLMAPVLAYVLWRSYQSFKGQQVNPNQQDGSTAAIIRAGLDSEFYQIERQLSEQGWARSPDESWLQWQERLRSQSSSSGFTHAWSTQHDETFSAILTLHNRYRFDPNGLSATDRQQLKTLTQTWFTLPPLPVKTESTPVSTHTLSPRTSPASAHNN